MNFAEMNKGALRQAMRDAGLSYKGMSVEKMRDALVAHNAPVDAPVVEAEIPAPVVQEEKPLFDNAIEAVVDAVAAAVAVQEVETAPAVQDAPSEEPALSVEEATQILTPVRGTSKGLKIEKDRPMQNGVRQPSAGGMCRAVWDYCTAQTAAGTMPTAKSVKAHADSVGWNLNNASIEYYNWRKFNGISGRQK